jgi:hypothetical protein
MTRVACYLFALFVFASCSAKEDAGDFFSRTESANEEADRRLGSGDQAGARAILREAAEAKVPADARRGDARAVRQDLLYRLAALELGASRPTEAARAATRGLELGRSKDVFTSNLLIVRGRAFEELGDPRGASRDYHDALLVTEALLDKSLEGTSP